MCYVLMCAQGGKKRVIITTYRERQAVPDIINSALVQMMHSSFLTATKGLYDFCPINESHLILAQQNPTTTFRIETTIAERLQLERRLNLMIPAPLLRAKRDVEQLKVSCAQRVRNITAQHAYRDPYVVTLQVIRAQTVVNMERNMLHLVYANCMAQQYKDDSKTCVRYGLHSTNEIDGILLNNLQRERALRGEWGRGQYHGLSWCACVVVYTSIHLPLRKQLQHRSNVLLSTFYS
jgi:hypothetical protein